MMTDRNSYAEATTEAGAPYVQPQQLMKLLDLALGAEADQREAQTDLRRAELRSAELQAKAASCWNELAAAITSLQVVGDGGETMSALRQSDMWTLVQALSHTRPEGYTVSANSVAYSARDGRR